MNSRWCVLCALCALLGSSERTIGQLPPIPVPAENPITESKRVLGKILFWDEQLSSNDTVACGTCHILSEAGADPRFARNPGTDGAYYTLDDILGSRGIARANSNNEPIVDPVYAFDPQVTGRVAPSMIASQYSPELFWDGRAGSTFYDPETGEVSIASGGAFENQAIGPIMSDVEMAHEARDWSELTAKLEAAVPLNLASDLPPDVASALGLGETYPDLFDTAFGDPEITAERIAFAIATYERTLFPDQTRWDLYVGGDETAMTPGQIQGWEFFSESTCAECHVPPLFTDHTYRNIGLRPIAEDSGRQVVTGLTEDRGKFKVPTLRNAGLKSKFMHTGLITRLENVVGFYLGSYNVQFPDNQDPLIVETDIPLPFLNPLLDFLSNGLTDPRVAAEEFPFDRPTLRSERVADFTAFANCLSGPGALPDPDAPLSEEECLDLYDLDGDDDVDLIDYPRLLWAFPDG